MALNHLSLLRPLFCRLLVQQVKSPLVATSRVCAPLLCPNTTCYPAACSRLYATKKAKAKAKGQSAKVNINTALVEDIISLDEVKEDMTGVLNALKDDFTRNLSIRTSPGVADVWMQETSTVTKMTPYLSSPSSYIQNQTDADNRKERTPLAHLPLTPLFQAPPPPPPPAAAQPPPGALDHIVVTTQDGKFPLNQLGQISMKSPQLIIVNMSSFPEATAAATHALRESSMNLNPEVDGTIIKVPVPKVTREHRENLVKLAKHLGNKAKDSLRRVRSNAVTQVKKAKEGHSEDTIRLVEKQIQQMADNMAADIDKQLAAKTKELLG